MADNQEIRSNKPTEDIDQLMKVRLDKLAELREAGKDPFVITKYDVTHHTKDIADNFEALEGSDVSIAGRLMSKRIMGKASFANVMDRNGNMQIYVTRDDLGEDDYKEFKKMDIGDLVGVEGFVFQTKTGEKSIHAKKMVLLSKSLKPLPEKFHGLTDTELRYRQRYVDLIMNPEVKDTFIKRSKIIATIRRFLDDKGFIEVETPMLVSNAGGAAARPFETHFNALDEDLKLRISLELYLKRLIVGGLERVYEIGRVFRNEGLDTRHNPEFTLMELYQAYTDYNGMMDLTEEMYRTVAQEVTGSTTITYNGIEMDLGKPFARVRMIDAIKEYAGVDFDKIDTLEEARAIAREKGIEFEERHQRGDIINLFFEEFCEDHMIQPTFVIDHPIEISPLTKKKPTDPRYVERFEFYMNGWEMANAYSELNDPIDQRERFAAQDALAEAGDDEAQHTDEDFLNALMIGMPPTGGIGYGIDRLCMLMTDSAAIRDVLLFPTMRTIGAAKPAEKKAENADGKDAKAEAPETKQNAEKSGNEVQAAKAAPQVSAASDGLKVSALTREQALELLKKYNQDPFHVRHALTVEGVMRWFAKELGHADEEEFWGQVGLLHDIDFEQFPEEHCVKAPELLKDGGVSDDMIRAICSHGYGLCCDVEPVLEMEKVLFAADELTGLIWSYALMRESKNCDGMEVSGLKKKFKDKRFAAGCSRDVIKDGAERLGWELTDLFDKTIRAMQSCEAKVNEQC
ncbi:MAG: lysine--tRNA ligase [Lachnospiraceae bacterium]|nr:lysine--tRNA ligase [Lachnospiraceae bacterium]